MSCGTPDGKHHKWTVSIQQHPLTEGPSYYYRLEGDYVALIPHESVRAKYTRFASDLGSSVSDPEMRRFIREILAAPQLQAYQDLYAYTLPEGDLWWEIRYLVVDLILGGEATIVNPGGLPVERVVAARSKGPWSSSTSIHINDENGERLLWRFECIS